jgi:hypothetical protein
MGHDRGMFKKKNRGNCQVVLSWKIKVATRKHSIFEILLIQQPLNTQLLLMQLMLNIEWKERENKS